METYYKYAEIIWDYHHLNQKISKADCVIAFGSHDLHVAERAADIINNGDADYIIFTGGLGRITKNLWHKSEAEKFREVAILRGVSEDRIFVETESTNTGENISYTQRLIKNLHLDISQAIVVDKPFKERRIFATLKKQWSDLNFTVASPEYTFDEYCKFYETSAELSIDDFINIMVGDLQRIIIYGETGLQIPQNVPNEVLIAYRHLINLGYSKQLLK